jgi:replicative DNA helicase
MTEVFAVDLDEELISHLAIPESWSALWDEEVSEELIEDEFAAEVFRWQLNHVREHGKPATASVLADEFDLDLDEPLTAAGDLVERLRDRYVRNNARRYMEQVSDAYKDDPAKVVEVLPRVARELQNAVGKRGEQYGTGDYLRAMHRYDERVLRGPGPSFGFAAVDDHFDSLHGLCFGIAAPKVGKSWIFGANTIVENVKNGKYLWLYSLELPADEADMRIRCLAAGVPYWKYIKRRLTQEERQTLAEASEMLDDLGIYKVAKPAIGHRSFEEMVERAGDAGAEGIVIDQLQYVETRNGKQLGGADPLEYWQPLNAARDMSDHMPILCIHQFNRSVMNADRMPEMQQAKGAAAIEETATLALGLWANKDMKRSNVVEMGTLAARNFSYEAWEIGVELSRGCDFELLGRAMHDED